MFCSKFTEEEELQLRMTMNEEDIRFWFKDDSVTGICGYYRMHEWFAKDGEDLLHWLLPVGGHRYALVGKQYDNRDISKVSYFIQGQGTLPYVLSPEDYQLIVSSFAPLSFRKSLRLTGEKPLFVYSLYIGDKELKVSYQDI